MLHKLHFLREQKQTVQPLYEEKYFIMSKKDSWICKNCSETLEKEFDSCWNCGTSKDGKKSQSFDSH